jgi:ribonuclease P protein component
VIALRDDRAPEVGIVASRSQVGGAVSRNRARRRIRAALDRLPLTEGGYIVIASRAVLTTPFEDLVRWLEAAMKEKRE